MLLFRITLLLVTVAVSSKLHAQLAELIHTVTLTETKDTLLDPLDTISLKSPVNEAALILSDSVSINSHTSFNYRTRLEYDQNEQTQRFDYQVQEFSFSTFAFDSWLFNFGKTQISWDMASSFQPLGFFQPTQNLFDLTDQQSLFSGVPLVAATYLQDSWSASFVYSNDYWSNDNGFNSGVEQWAMRLQWVNNDFDWSLVLQRPSGQNIGVGTSIIGSVNDHSVSYFSVFYRQGTRQPQNQQLLLAQPSFAEFFPFQSNLKQANQPFWRGVIGTSLSTSFGDFVFELTHDERNLDAVQWSRLEALIELHSDTVLTTTDADLQQLAATNLFYNNLSLNPDGARQGYAFVNVQNQWLGGTLSLFSRLSLQDKSGLYGLTYNKEFSGKLSMFVSGQRFFGNDTDEFSLIPIKQSLQITFRYIF